MFKQKLGRRWLELDGGGDHRRNKCIVIVSAIVRMLAKALVVVGALTQVHEEIEMAVLMNGLARGLEKSGYGGELDSIRAKGGMEN